MESTQKRLTMADVAGWGSAVVTFGLIQGALYLKAYWGHFGLDPFQFVAVSELALAGLAGIGMVLILMLVASLFGGWVEIKVTSGSAKSKCRCAWAARSSRRLPAIRNANRCVGSRRAGSVTLGARRSRRLDYQHAAGPRCVHRRTLRSGCNATDERSAGRQRGKYHAASRSRRRCERTRRARLHGITSCGRNGARRHRALAVG
ncbi:hypothetical protein SRABI102_00006 [Stenotrophomonas lactitubi]|nr:hypothetical protein SRABI102_00006 [Stenotrophomonas lactitubi]CAH0132807.1 hypothetical protein SRABI66_00272 [Stenotrophomonas lactitubi]CAH0133204.1 hypothetical protein SRABI81_00283 [Stenotrophomonas lactitubi]CAH0145517.1 hypothetical protein SRABI122_00571 [Stenotrophomonas lactitubi]